MRTVGSNREITWPIIRKASIDLIYQHGFEAMNLRDLAHAAGLKGAGSLYNYFGSKQDLLFRIMCEVMEDIQAELEQNINPVQCAASRMRIFIAFHIRWHSARRKETRISHPEMPSLPPERYQQYVRSAQKIRAVRHAADRGWLQKRRLFCARRTYTQSILSMLASVCKWYHLDGPRQSKAPDRHPLPLANGAGYAPRGDRPCRLKDAFPRPRPASHP